MELTLGVAAHVDAGKTTLCERILERTGVLRRFGRVERFVSCGSPPCPCEKVCVIRCRYDGAFSLCRNDRLFPAFMLY